MRSRTIVRTGRLAAVSISLGLALTLTACGSEDSSADSGTEAESSAPASESASASASAAPAGKEVEVKIGKTFKDPETGDTIEVISAVRDFPSEEGAEVVAEGGEMVLLQVKVTPGKEFGGLIQDGNFQISWDKGADFWSPDTDDVATELTAAKRKPFEDVSRRDGGEHTGWIAFEVDEKGDTYVVEYERPAAKIIGSDKTIAEFKEQVEIPAG